MGLVAKIRSSLSPRTRLLDEFAVIAGRCESLAASLKRHAAMCDAPKIKHGLAELAAAEVAHANALREILLEHRRWPSMPQTPARDGSSNWERANADLTLQSELMRDLIAQLARWQGIEPALAARLRELAAVESQSLAKLRDLALRCDTYAID